MVDTPLWHPSAGTTLDSVLNLRIQQDVTAHIKLASGRLPTGATRTIPDPTPGANKDSTLLVLEVAMSSETASKLGLAIGGQLILDPEKSDPLAANRGVRLAADLVGTYEVTDPADPFWMGDSSVDHTYTYALSALVEYVGGTMLIAPEAYPALMTATQPSGLPMIYHWRSYVGTADLQSSELDALAAALRRAATIYPPATPALSNGGQFGGVDQRSPASLQSGLLGLITAHQARWLSGATILTILWTGAGLVILASLALVAETIARRRRVSLAVVGRRGASAGQIASAILSESAILVLPAAWLGTIVSVLLIPVTDQGPTLLVAVAGALGAIVFIALASRRNRAIDLVERPRRLRRLGSGRLVAEALIVGLAVVGASPPAWSLGWRPRGRQRDKLRLRDSRERRPRSIPRVGARAHRARGRDHRRPPPARRPRLPGPARCPAAGPDRRPRRAPRGARRQRRGRPRRCPDGDDGRRVRLRSPGPDRRRGPLGIVADRRRPIPAHGQPEQPRRVPRDAAGGRRCAGAPSRAWA